ncbi:Olfactory receptor 2T33 [Heterocephalus glaber]|uniref:Olfactory receptor 2T33 n=1 Tax=Heterocephalus glaber TaxID=10181 RepID=G5BBE9_HETGA|nr:Olfactory receptor 2T33 [Heterocephalus glaber]
MVADYLTGNKSIFPVGCGLQIFFIQTTGGGECFLLATMSCDCYVAVCHLLSNTSAFEYGMYICCVLVLLIPLSLILMFYSLIFPAVLHMLYMHRIPQEDLATCSSHLAMVGLYYGVAIFIYMRPKSYRSAKHNKVLSAVYMIFTPMLNPKIYSLRNNGVNGALRKCLTWCAVLRND